MDSTSEIIFAILKDNFVGPILPNFQPAERRIYGMLQLMLSGAVILRKSSAPFQLM